MQSGSSRVSQKLSRNIDGASVVASSDPGSSGRWTQVAVKTAEALSTVISACHASQAAVLTYCEPNLAANATDREYVFIDFTSMKEILHHEPQDMVISVQTGITISALNNYLLPFKQWFPVAADENSTVLDVINRGDGGPLEQGFGAVRDLVLGLKVCTGRGALIDSGGTVVKNVTGYDTTKLFVGSHGTLGIPYVAHLRLFARPEKTAAVLFHGMRADDLLLLASDLIAADLTLTCLEFFDLGEFKSSGKLPDSILRLTQKWGDFGLFARISGPDELIKELLPQIRSFKKETTSNVEVSAADATNLLHTLSLVRYPVFELTASHSEMRALLSEWTTTPVAPTFKYRPSTGRAFIFPPDASNMIEMMESLRSYLIRRGAPNTVALANSRCEYEIEYLGADIKKVAQIKASLKERFDPHRCLNPLAVL